MDRIASAAFASQHPAKLGSRCTVFMNSSIITEQRNGKLPGDIMAGLCRSIIENVFTKVIRISNLDSLGDTIVVQAAPSVTMRCLQRWSSTSAARVTRAPYPGIMGAIGAALLTKERMKDGRRTFIGLDALEHFSYTQTANSPCPFCMNHCKRTIITFSNGSSWVTNNRCEKGEILGNPADAAVREQVREKTLEKEKSSEPVCPAGKAPVPGLPLHTGTKEGHGHRAAPGALLLGQYALLEDLFPGAWIHCQGLPAEHPQTL